MEDDAFKKYELVYKECAANYRYYLDWRFKILTRHAVAVSAAFLSFKFIIDSNLGNAFASIPLFLFSLLSLAFFRMDTRHEDLAHSAAKIASKIEEVMIDTKKINSNPGFYYYQANNRPKIFTHSMMFRLIYLVSFGIGFIGACATIIVVSN